MLPFEFVVVGTPISLQARAAARSRWKARVAAAARVLLPSPPLLTPDPVRVRVMYFFVSGDADLDNILKPIFDSLVGLVYVDDAQIIDISAVKRDLGGTYTVTGVSAALAAHLATSPGADFVYVGLERADPNVIP